MLDIILQHEVIQQSIICHNDYNTILLLYVTKIIHVKYFCHVLLKRNMISISKVPPCLQLSAVIKKSRSWTDIKTVTARRHRPDNMGNCLGKLLSSFLFFFTFVTFCHSALVFLQFKIFRRSLANIANNDPSKDYFRNVFLSPG